MALKDQIRLEDLCNIAEDLVIDELDRQMGENALEDFSEDTILDIAACALNMIKPLYRANLMGRVYADAFRQEYHDEIEKAVRTSIEKVIVNP